MAGAGTPGKRRIVDRRLVIAAVILWIGALALAGTYATERSRAGAAAAVTTTAAVVAAVPSTLSSATSAPPTTSPSTDHPPVTGPPTTEPPTTSTTSTTSTTEKVAQSLTVAAGGDVQGDRKVGTYIDAHGGAAALAKVRPYLQTADLAFVNLEGPISDKGTKLAWKEYTFRSRLALAQGLAAAGVDVVSMANNHAVDCGQSALLDTIARLDKVGIEHAGAGKDISAARTPAMLSTPAGTVAVLAFTDKFASGFAAGTGRPGVAPISDGTKIIEAIKAAKDKADYVIVSFHWGTEYTTKAAAYQRALAHRAIDAGADLILGHHPHVIQGLEVYKDKLIAYSLGDFVFDHRPGITGQAFVLRVTLHHSGPPVARIIPVYLSDSSGIPAVVTGDTADIILDRLTALSASLGTKLTRSGDQAWLGAAGGAD
jgi:poly-gamma-glutamate capsule biosynthesis protein CapA/YwtB (metallophosphatase superfamily)